MVVVAIALALLGSGVGPSLPDSHPPAGAPSTGISDLARAPTRAPVGPGAGVPYIFQEGIEYVSEDGELGIPPADIVAKFALPNATLSGIWTLGGLSSTGDQYFLWAANGIPYGGAGCPTSGFSLGYEVRTAAGTLGPTECVTGITPVPGDAIELELNLACGGHVAVLCLTLSDLTLGRSSSPSVSQPTGNASYFANDDPSAPNPYGYFTGVETVTADPVAPSGCLEIPSLPTVSYYLQAYLPTDSVSGFLGLNLSAYQVFANETEPDGTSCGGYVSPSQTVPSTNQTVYYQGGGSAVGSHWVAVQNWTGVVGGPSMGRFQTDVVPVTATMTLNTSSVDLGQSVEASVAPSGGTGPYACRWSFDGTPFGGSSCTQNFTASQPGVDNISALATDPAGENGLAYAALRVAEDPSLVAPDSAPGSIDLGQYVVFFVQVSGGAGRITYNWSTPWTPAACGPLTAPLLNCTPTEAGPAEIRVSVMDVHGVSATSPVLNFTVYPDPNVTVALDPGFSGHLDVGQTATLVANVTGGAGGIAIGWSLIDPSCVVLSLTLRCTMHTAGLFPAQANVRDANGVTAVSAPIDVFVNPLPVVRLESPAPNITLGGSLVIDTTTTLGEPPYSYAWSNLPGGCAPPSNSSFQCRPTALGTFDLAVNVTDAFGGRGSAVLVVTVSPLSTGPAPTPVADLEAVAAAAAVAILVLAVVLVSRRRARPPGRTPPDGYVLVSGPTVRPPSR